jgi:hypothetical protein
LINAITVFRLLIKLGSLVFRVAAPTYRGITGEKIAEVAVCQTIKV